MEFLYTVLLTMFTPVQNGDHWIRVKVGEDQRKQKDPSGHERPTELHGCVFKVICVDSLVEKCMHVSAQIRDTYKEIKLELTNWKYS